MREVVFLLSILMGLVTACTVPEDINVSPITITPTRPTTIETVEVDTSPLPYRLTATPTISGAQVRSELDYQYISLNFVSGKEYLATASWADDHSLVYATAEGITEPKDYNWQQYDLLTRQERQLPPPISAVSNNVRQRLNLCPLNISDWTDPTECWEVSRLFESPVSDRMLYSPVTNGAGELWLANKDGTHSTKISDFRPSYAQWSSDGKWLTTGEHFPGSPGQETHYLIATSGTFIESLSRVTKTDHFLLDGLFPKFSPGGQKLTYVGSKIYESVNENDYHLYSLDLQTLESQIISERIGLFQWSNNGQGMYILDGALYPLEGSRELRATSLYFVDMTQEPFQETLIANDIPYHPPNSLGTWHWAYMPATKALAYVGFERKEKFGVLLLDPMNSE